MKFSLPQSGREILTLSLEGSTLRVLQARGRRITAWLSLPFNPAFLSGGFIADPTGMAEVIRNALIRKGLHARRVRAAFPGFQSLSRLITLPRAKELHPEEILPGEARRLMRISLEDTYLFWQRVAITSRQQRFLVLAIPKAPLQTFVETLRLAGLRPSRLELKPLSLVKAVGQPQAIIASVETNGIDIVIVIDHLPMLMRSLYLGEGALTLETVPSPLVDELSHTISFYNNSNPDKQLPSGTPLYLCGALASGLDASAIGQEFGMPAGELHPVLNVPPEFPLAQMLVNLGLAIG
ncbi:MAG: hypothetical protein DRI26_04160 [Chloroflexi bacterium]|nr:MAG: hypothetical protein DRI26_04160 [Chloroflexota bacterium]